MDGTVQQSPKVPKIANQCNSVEIAKAVQMQCKRSANSVEIEAQQKQCKYIENATQK